MNGTLTLIDLAGWIALLLWGVHMVQRHSQVGREQAWWEPGGRVDGAG